jgi:hypothetical protein
MCLLIGLRALYMGAFLNLLYTPVVSETSVTSPRRRVPVPNSMSKGCTARLPVTAAYPRLQ